MWQAVLWALGMHPVWGQSVTVAEQEVLWRESPKFGDGDPQPEMAAERLSLQMDRWVWFQHNFPEVGMQGVRRSKTKHQS